MPLTPRNVAAVGNQFMGQPYGWGGLDGKRDCSAVTHDLFVPFGIYLPRNSGSQAAAGGAIPLGDMGNAQKESTILSQGVPFATLIWMKGHIMVYVGQWQGHPLIFHAPWGLHTFGNGGRDGRLVIGRVVVTTLRPGEEVPAVGPQHLLLKPRAGDDHPRPPVARRRGEACAAPGPPPGGGGGQRAEKLL